MIQVGYGSSTERLIGADGRILAALLYLVSLLYYKKKRLSIGILKFLCTISGTFVYQIWYISEYYKKMLRFRRSIFSFL